jgi:hypothetical protein
MIQKIKRKNLLAVLIMGFFMLIPGFVMGVELKPGDVIDSGNIDQYKDYFPMFMQRYIKDGWGIEKPVVITMGKNNPTPWPKGFLEASEKNVKTCKVTADGLLEGYTGVGQPFPRPEEPNLALKLMWNQFYKCVPDDTTQPTGFLDVEKRKGGSCSFQINNYEQIMFANRTMLAPMPELDNPKQLYYAMKLSFRSPPNKDMAMLTWRYKDPLRDDDMWTYVPTLRRTLRMVSSERANPIRGSPYTWDDIFGFDGKIPMFNYKLVGEQTLVVLNHEKYTSETVDRKNYPWHPISYEGEEFETQDSYVVEITSKDLRYPQARKTIWLNKNRFVILYAQMYDKAGEFWKGFWNSFRDIKVKTTYGEEIYPVQGSNGITDFKTSYWILIFNGEFKSNLDVDPAYYSPGALGTF